MPTLGQMRNHADDWLQARWSTVQTRQENYKAAHGVYWQGLRSHTVEVNHTTADYDDQIADNLAGHPTDQSDNWLDILPEVDGIAFPAVFVMDVYKGPLGDGYVATVYAKYNGTIYSRSQNVGPESWRTLDWFVVE